MDERAPGADSGRMYRDTERIRHFQCSDDAAAYYGLRDGHRFVEVRYDHHPDETDPDVWTVDEIVTPGLHLEMLDQDTCWMNIKGVHVVIRAVRVKGQRELRLLVTCFPADATPVTVERGSAEGDER